jgi:hypothetical protein
VKMFQISCSTDAIAPSAGAAVDATVAAQLLEKCARRLGKNTQQLRVTMSLAQRNPWLARLGTAQTSSWSLPDCENSEEATLLRPDRRMVSQSQFTGAGIYGRACKYRTCLDV